MMLSIAVVMGLTLSVEGQRGPEWRDYAGGPDSSRFVTSTQITKLNVKQLEVAWAYPSGQTDFNPIVVRGTVYGRGANGSFVALDAATGKQIWIHEGVQGFASRGVNYWESKDGKDRRLIFSASNLLQEIDAVTGEPISSFGVNGRVDLRVGLDRDPTTINQQSRTPGRVFENLIILGSATNQEYASAPGDIRAFDVRTGALVWTFHTVPRPGEFGYDTWPPDAWKTVGGANNWGEQSIDDKRGIVYVPTGSPKYNFYGGNRQGANLFGDCLIALDARTGKRLWHFQTVHHDIWDLDNNSAPQLTTIRQNGKAVDVVAMASKTGYLYVFDRVTGRPIWPIEERPVPQNTSVPGEVLWPTQPFPTAPPPFSRQKFTVDDLNPHILTPEEREEFRQRIAKARNEGPFTPIGFEEVIHMPGNQGGSNWGSTAANPSDGSVYVIGFNVPTIIRLLKPGEMRSGRGGAPPDVVKEGRYVTEGFGLYPTIISPPYTTLTAYDLNKGTISWQIGLGDDLRLVGQGVTGTGTAASIKGGIIATATGLLFVTAADRKVHVYDSATGKQLSELLLGGESSTAMFLHRRARSGSSRSRCRATDSVRLIQPQRIVPMGNRRAEPLRMTFDLQPALRGDLLEMRPLRQDDFEALFAVASDPLIWEQHPSSDRYREDVFTEFFSEALHSGGALVAIDRKDGRVIGSSRFHGYDHDNSEVEIGWTFLARSHWGGIYNREMKRLMLRHAFRFVTSVVFLIGPRNIRSQRAVEKIGGIHVGSRRDASGRESYVYRLTSSAFHNTFADEA